MKLQAIHFQPSVVLLFSKNELDVITNCALRHYDATCRMAAQFGGFVYGMNNKGEGTHHLELSQVDLLCKILEIDEAQGNANQEISIEIASWLHKVFATATESTPGNLVF